MAKQRKYGDCIKSKSHTETERRNRRTPLNVGPKFQNVGILIHTFNNPTSKHIRSTHSMITFGTHGDLASGRMGKRSDGTRLNGDCRAICAPYNRSRGEPHGFPVRTGKRLYGAAIGKSHTQMLFPFEQSKRNVWKIPVVSPKEHSTSNTHRVKCGQRKTPNFRWGFGISIRSGIKYQDRWKASRPQPFRPHAFAALRNVPGSFSSRPPKAFPHSSQRYRQEVHLPYHRPFP